ncbi:hypothetical protein [Rhodococcoides trifolii]|nr:hypothetical protein [Rhodococcus trifolii]
MARQRSNYKVRHPNSPTGLQWAILTIGLIALVVLLAITVLDGRL